MKAPRRTCVAALAAALVCANATTAAAFTATGHDNGEHTPLNLGPSTGAGAAHSVASSGGSIVRTVLMLLLVVGLIYGATWLLKRTKRRGGGRIGHGLETIASLPLAPGRSLSLVRAGSDFVLVGISEQGVTPVGRYTAEEARDAGLLADDDDLAGAVHAMSPSAARALNASLGADPPRNDLSVDGILQTLRRWTIRS